MAKGQGYQSLQAISTLEELLVEINYEIMSSSLRMRTN